MIMLIPLIYDEFDGFHNSTKYFITQDPSTLRGTPRSFPHGRAVMGLDLVA